MIMCWNEFFMRNVYLYASKSKDESTKVGAVLVKNNTIISGGYNGICRGVDDNMACRHARPEKYFWMSHSEVNAIFNAARIGISTLDSDLYTSGLPCASCARGIIQSGIQRVIVHAPWYYQWARIQLDNPEWSESMKRTLVMFEESKIVVEYFYDQLKLPARIGGKNFEL